MNARFITSLDNPLYQDFVAPSNCKLLSAHAGINTDTPFVWKLQPDETCLLFSLAFDPDGYYTAGELGIQQFNPPLIPAYQLKDMEKLLPDYYMEKEDRKYRVKCEKWFPAKVFTDFRLPDVFARIVYTALMSGHLQPVLAIELIKKTV